MLIDNYFVTGAAEGSDTVGENAPAPPVPPPGVGQSLASAAPETLAVLPFVNTSSDAEQEHFVDGLSEELMGSLGRIEGLAVTGRNSAFFFKGRNDDLATIAGMLKVDHLLSGSVRRSGDQLRIAAQLVDAGTGFQIWSETYERTIDEIFAIQDDISRSVAEALQITLGVGVLGRIPGMTRNVAGYEELLAARGAYGEFRPESMRRAVEHLERAIALDPAAPLLWFALWNTYNDGAQLVPDEIVQWREGAARAFERARTLMPDAPYVRAAQAIQSADRGQWREAAAFFEAQSSEFPGNGQIVDRWRPRGIFLLRVGRASDAIPDLERARNLDPLSGLTAVFLGDAYGNAGALPAALAEHDRGLGMDREVMDFLRGSALVTALATHDRSEIERRIRAMVENPGVGTDLNAALARYLDEPARGLAEIRALAMLESPEQNPLAFSILTSWAAYYGDPELALALVRRIPAAENGSTIGYLLWRPVMSEVRALPGFKDLVRELGFVDYWREYEWSDFCRPVGEDDFQCG